MKSQKSKDATFAALGFLVATLLSLIVSKISNETGGTRAPYWLAATFIALLAAGALIEWARNSKPKKDESPPSPPGPMPHQGPPRTVRSVLAGAVSGLAASVLFFLLIGPGSLGPPTAGPSPTATSTPGTTSPAPSPDPAASSPASTGQLVTASAAPGDGGTQFHDDMTVTVTTARPLPTGSTYWLIVQFLGGSNIVYKAEGKVPATAGTTHYTLSIATAAVGSTREIYIVQADSQATSMLAQNYTHPEPSWDGNRTSLPSGVVTVSNSITVTKQ